MIRVSQRLRNERLKKGLTLDEVSKATKIRINFLSAIENGDYQKLPSSTYAQGFVKNYAEFLGLSKNEILALFRREFNEDNFFKVLPEGLTNPQEINTSEVRFSGKLFILILIFIILLFYAVFQYRYAILNPPLEIYSPKEAEVVSLRTTTVVGKTDPNATVYINESSVSIDQNGNFKKNIDLFTGKSTIKVKVINYFGRQTYLERHIEVKNSS